MLVSTISDIICRQRNFFQTGKTKDVAFRLTQLKTLKQAVVEHESAIAAALQADLHKPEFETYATEIAIVKKEIDYAIKHIKAWTKPKKAAIGLEHLPATGYIQAEPLGVVLIIGTWNYPFQLVLTPLVGAIAAGNCAILKPSELAPHTSEIVAKVLQSFEPNYIAVVEGGIESSQQLLTQKFDRIFFTGSSAVGKIVMEAAAKHLTPVTLELGGKSPCIVDRDINLEYTARRITWGKFLNAGQTCTAPDYLLVEQAIAPKLLDSIKKCIREFYGDEPANSPDYARIINYKHFHRLVEFFQDGEIVIGGKIDSDKLYIAPTLLDRVSLEAPVMQEEIFGPILPVITYNGIQEAIAIVNQRPKPLALYIFSQNKNLQQEVLQSTSSGGVCINDTVLQCAVSTLPFGGVGNSGIGSYHGKASFDTFSHYKSVLNRPLWLDIKLRYAPYKNKLPLLKRILG